jgi:hypothetical protein
VEIVGILRLLSRRPMLVAIGAVAAIAVSILAAGGETKETGTASARLVLDTAKSQLIYRAPSGAETLPWRAMLLSDLSGSKALTDRIASQVGIRTNELAVVHPDLAAPVTPAALPTRAAEVADVISEKYILTVRFNEPLPIISLEAQAPDRDAAVRLVGAAMGALKDTGTPAPAAPGTQGLVVESVGPVRSKAIVREPQSLLGPALAIVLFGVWCAGVALIPRRLGAWRAAGRPPHPA